MVSIEGDKIMDNTHRIVQVKGHYEVHDCNGKFILSGDTWDECYNDLVKLLVAKAEVIINSENRKMVTA